MRSIGAAFLIVGTLGMDNMLTVFITPPSTRTISAGNGGTKEVHDEAMYFSRSLPRSTNCHERKCVCAVHRPSDETARKFWSVG